MNSDPIFHSLTTEDLLEICQLLTFDPHISSAHELTLNRAPHADRRAWADRNRTTIEKEITRVGSWSFLANKDYAEIVRDIADKMGATYPVAAPIQDVERALLVRIWNSAISKLTPSQVKELNHRAAEISAKYGKTLGKELTGFAALSAAQLSGFGIYVLGSTILGALNSALGLGLGFGAFMGLSSLISTVIGPLGWASLGLVAVVKLGAPNHKKLLPVVVFIAAKRSLIQEKQGGAACAVDNAERIFQPKPILLPSSFGSEIYDGLARTPSEGLPSAGPSERTRQPVSAFEVDVESAANAAQETKSVSPEQPPSRRIVSELDRVEFEQRPENKVLCEIAYESAGRHFLDLPEADQEDVREMAAERAKIEALQQRANSSSPKANKSSEKSNHNRREPDASRAKRNVEKLRKEYKVTWKNLEFSDEALQRMLKYKSTKTNLHLAALETLSHLNQGIIADKHHVPETDPKVFQKDCGKTGKVYYRRANGTNGIYVALIGDKSSQGSDYRKMRCS